MKEWPPPFEYEPYEVVEVSEGRKTWYEVRSGYTVVSDAMSGAPWRFRTLKRAQRYADKENAKQSDRVNRVERVVK